MICSYYGGKSQIDSSGQCVRCGAPEEDHRASRQIVEAERSLRMAEFNAHTRMLAGMCRCFGLADWRGEG